MINSRRILIATLTGFVTGIFCYLLASSLPGSIQLASALHIILSRTLAGFVIGISALKLGSWASHGGIIGAVLSIPLACSGLPGPENPEFSKAVMFIITVLLGSVYGLFIEAITSLLFNARYICKE